MNTIEYTVPNISCGHCVNTIQTEVGEMEGVVSVVALHDTKRVTIKFDAPASEAGIMDLLTEINYSPA